MSEQQASYRIRGGGKLRVVKPEESAERDADHGVTNDDPEAERAGQKAAADASAGALVLGNAVMHAAMSWVACCMEKQGESVGVMPLGGGLFDAEVKLSGGDSIWLRVRLVLEAGPVLSTRVEPVHP